MFSNATLENKNQYLQDQTKVMTSNKIDIILIYIKKLSRLQKFKFSVLKTKTTELLIGYTLVVK